MSTFNGYQDRISNTYWTSSDVTWDGVKWSAGTVSEFTMTPQTAAKIAHATEIRFRLKLNTVAVLELHNGAGGVARTWLLPAVIGQYVVPRFDPSGFSAIRFAFDNPSSVEVHEIEIGYTGTF
jgi:hypothetical protein